MSEETLREASRKAEVLSVQLDQALFHSPQLMDQEAGARWGLEEYGRFLRPEMHRPRHEVEWSRRLAELLRHDGILVRVGELYLALPKARCDLRLTLPNGARIWLEIRGAWKSFLARRGALRVYRSQLLHPLVAGLDPRNSTAALDLRHLASLTARDADGTAFLLVGFDDRLHPLSDDVETFDRLSSLDTWACARASWPHRLKADHFVRVWLWIRDLQL